MPNIRVAQLVCEFFDETLRLNRALGGYGMLARNYIAHFLPDGDLQVETILGYNNAPEVDIATVDRDKKVVLLPAQAPYSRFQRLPGVRGFKRRAYLGVLSRILSRFDVFLSVETMPYGPLVMKCAFPKKLILYVQDPRPQSEWDELDTVVATDDGSPRPSQEIRAFYKSLIEQGRLIAISQGSDLIGKARDLYGLPQDFPIRIVRNPVIVEKESDPDLGVKEDAVLFLGRLDPVKRPWLALEIARRMPDVQFYFLGKLVDKMVPYIIYNYRDLPNVKMLGHQAGNAKAELLRKCKILLNTSIHEAIPVSFLEALANGTLIVSCQNPDNMVSQYGAFTGKVLGDGRDQAGLFVDAIRGLLNHEDARRDLARKGRDHVIANHDVNSWVKDMRQVVREAVSPKT